MTAMLKILSAEPNRIFSLSRFCDLFGSAKSSLSEDIDALQKTVSQFGLGRVETVTGAAGGVRYRPEVRHKDACAFIRRLCDVLSGSDRVLPGGFLYYSDILTNPVLTRRMGEIIATAYYQDRPDFVLTMETMGIPVANAAAAALGVPLVIARHTSRVYEGSAVNINYVSGSNGAIETMSLSRRAVKEGSRCLIVDDFLRGGGTAKGMRDLMREFNAQVVGMAFVMSTAVPEKKRISGEKSLMILSPIGEEDTSARIVPAPWLTAEANEERNH